MPAKTGVELLPIFRTDAQWAVLAALFVDRADQELSIAELARVGGLSPTATHREVERLIGAGLLTDRRVGRNRLVAANLEHPAAAPLRSLLALTTGPLRALGALYSVSGVEQVVIHGSWARRYRGEPGAFPRDIDVLAIGHDVDEVDVRLAAQQLGEELGVDIRVEAVSGADWHEPPVDGVLAAIKSGPLEVVPRP